MLFLQCAGERPGPRPWSYFGTGDTAKLCRDRGQARYWQQAKARSRPGSNRFDTRIMQTNSSQFGTNTTERDHLAEKPPSVHVGDYKDNWTPLTCQ